MTIPRQHHVVTPPQARKAHRQATTPARTTNSLTMISLRLSPFTPSSKSQPSRKSFLSRSVLKQTSGCANSAPSGCHVHMWCASRGAGACRQRFEPHVCNRSPTGLGARQSLPARWDREGASIIVDARDVESFDEWCDVGPRIAKERAVSRLNAGVTLGHVAPRKLRRELR